MTNSKVRPAIQKSGVQIDGVIQKIDTSKLTTEDNSSVDDTDSGDSSYSDDSSSEGSNAFITILSTGAYRIKGTVNEIECKQHC